MPESNNLTQKLNDIGSLLKTAADNISQHNLNQDTIVNQFINLALNYYKTKKSTEGNSDSDTEKSDNAKKLATQAIDLFKKVQEQVMDLQKTHLNNFIENLDSNLLSSGTGKGFMSSFQNLQQLQTAFTKLPSNIDDLQTFAKEITNQFEKVFNMAEKLSQSTASPASNANIEEEKTEKQAEEKSSLSMTR